MKLLLIAGARPNFMKVAPLIKAIQAHNREVDNGEQRTVNSGPPIESGDQRTVNSAENPQPTLTVPDSLSNPHSPCTAPNSPPTIHHSPFTVHSSPFSAHRSPLTVRRSPATVHHKLVHTGQHYDAKMSDVFFQELGIPAPDINLGVGSGSHAVQTANIMLKFEPVLEAEKPDWVVVVGDVNSTMACTLVASKMGVKVAHVEAGLRSFDRTMPEEINRLVTDSIADLLLTPSEDANENLRREGVAEGKIKLVGNIMIDALVANLDQAQKRDTLQKHGLEARKYAFVTLHRPANVDHKESLQAIMNELNRLAREIPVVFPMHPRTRKMLAEFNIAVDAGNGMKILDPIGYHDSLNLTKNARFVLTDSGGLQEESTYFTTPCLTLRPNTERPITITVGSNRLTDVTRLHGDIDRVLESGASKGKIPDLWDGKTANRILDYLIKH